MADVRKLEEARLAFVYAELVKTQKRLQDLIATKDASGMTDLVAMAGEVRLNHDNLADNLDTFANIEALNRQIDQYNLQLESSKKQLDKVERLLPSPYFGKVLVDFLDGEPPEALYIGVNGFTDEQGTDLIYDWRSPVAELFYNNQLGASSYQIDQGEVSVAIEKRRQLLTEYDCLINWFDSGTAIQDDVLLAALAEDTSTQMKDITATIQREQNLIIRDTKHPVVLVNGVAGSGKTSAIMQRIAYLLYRNRGQLSAEEMLILSPNQAFGKYIAQVLPALGEANPVTYTLLQLVKKLMVSGGAELEDETAYFNRISGGGTVDQTGITEILRSPAFLEALITERDETPQFHAIGHKGKTLITVAHLERLYAATPSNRPLQERIQGMKLRLAQEWERHLIRQSRSEQLHQQLLSLTEEQQRKMIGHLLEEADEELLEEYSLRLLRRRYQGVVRQIQELDWLDEEELFATYFRQSAKQELPSRGNQGAEMLTVDLAIAKLYFRHHLIEPILVPDFKVIMVDEVQDYSAAALQFLQSLFPKSRFTLVGDENQAIFDSHSRFTTMISLFGEQRVTYYPLVKSYRSSGNITRLFGSLLKETDTIEIQGIRPAGREVAWLELANETDLREAVLAYATNLPEGNLTILTKTAQEAQEVASVFADQPQIAVYAITLAKGLEFANVLLVAVSKANYHQGRDRQLLYTGISRGTETVGLMWSGQLSPLLKGQAK